MNIALALIGVVLVASIVYAAVNEGRRMSSGRLQPGAADHIATDPGAAVDEAETMDRAALRLVGDKLPYITENHAAAGWTNVDALDAADEKARGLQAWADSLPKGAWRSALTKWIKISQNGYAAARAELRTHALRDERKKQSQGFDLERKQEERLIAKMPRPPGDIRPLNAKQPPPRRMTACLGCDRSPTALAGLLLRLRTNRPSLPFTNRQVVPYFRHLLVLASTFQLHVRRHNPGIVTRNRP